MRKRKKKSPPIRTHTDILTLSSLPIWREKEKEIERERERERDREEKERNRKGKREIKTESDNVYTSDEQRDK